jgi:hypothetical protein
MIEVVAQTDENKKNGIQRSVGNIVGVSSLVASIGSDLVESVRSQLQRGQEQDHGKSFEMRWMQVSSQASWCHQHRANSSGPSKRLWPINIIMCYSPRRQMLRDTPKYQPHPNLHLPIARHQKTEFFPFKRNFLHNRYSSNPFHPSLIFYSPKHSSCSLLLAFSSVPSNSCLSLSKMSSSPRSDMMHLPQMLRHVITSGKTVFARPFSCCDYARMRLYQRVAFLVTVQFMLSLVKK